MRTIIRLLRSYGYSLFFGLLLGLGLWMLLALEGSQRVAWSIWWRSVEAHADRAVTRLSSYLRLARENGELQQENEELQHRIARLELQVGRSGWSREAPYVARGAASSDSLPLWESLSGRVVSNSVATTRNYFMVDRGARDGVEERMAVLSHGAVAGFVVSVSPRYALAISLLNEGMHLSVRLLANGYSGSLQWKAPDYRRALLNDIPHHVPVEAGDTVVTSGFSNIFPEGMLVGTVSKVENQGGDFCRIEVNLDVDFKRLGQVALLKGRDRAERDSLAKEARRGT